MWLQRPRHLWTYYNLIAKLLRAGYATIVFRPVLVYFKLTVFLRDLYQLLAGRFPIHVLPVPIPSWPFSDSGVARAQKFAN